VPEVRPFRALRYEPDVVGDLAAVVSPPYDAIDREQATELLARHPKNAVRIDLPTAVQGDEPDDQYRRAARTFAAWRSDGTFRKDPRPSLYPYEQVQPGQLGGSDRVSRGFFGRLRLEPLAPDSAIRTAQPAPAQPRDDRYKLLRATGVNTSPIIGRYVDPSGQAASVLAETARTNPLIDLTDDNGVGHRLWALVAEGPDAERVMTLIAAVAAGPITVDDSSERYESALRYRDERRMSRSCEEDPAFDYILTLFLESADDAASPPRPATGLLINPHEW
jgi:uncharacterized protein (DUF1015 family)